MRNTLASCLLVLSDAFQHRLPLQPRHHGSCFFSAIEQQVLAPRSYPLRHSSACMGTEINGAEEWMRSMNDNTHKDELETVARAFSPASEDDFERIEHVEIVSVDEDGMELHEVLCSIHDDRCIAIKVPVAWGDKCELTEGKLRCAFDRVRSRAVARRGDDDGIPVKYEQQQEELMGLMKLLNRDFVSTLRYFALKHAQGALTPTEELEGAHMTQLNLEGFTLELRTIDLESCLQKRRSEVSMLYEEPCDSLVDVEETLVRMFALQS